jgi:hypothetical protein
VPGTDFSRVLLASALGHLGEVDEARRIWQELKEINPKYSLSEHFARQPFKKEEGRPADCRGSHESRIAELTGCLSSQSIVVLSRAYGPGPLIFAQLGTNAFQDFSWAKRQLDQLSGVTSWRLHDLRRTCVRYGPLGVAPHVADKILKHQSGTISGVAAVYQRHEFLAERKAAFDLWVAHVAELIKNAIP